MTREAGSVWRHRGFTLQFAADLVSTMGSTVSMLALQFLLIDTLHADQRAIGWARSTQWAPYLFLGLAAGVVAERMRRCPC